MEKLTGPVILVWSTASHHEAPVRTTLASLLPFWLWTCAAGHAADRFEFADGDRVVLIGGTVIEREQEYGYWETALTLLFPDRNITFRNLGWSGDTVWGEARAGFDTPAEGYRRLVEHVLELKPTVIIIGYGTNESFAGEAGRPKFEAQLNKLLDDLAPTKARLILLAPPMFEEARWRAGHFAERKRDLQLYTDTIRQVARLRKAVFADEVGQRYGPAFPLTENGVHFSASGYQWTAHGVCNELGLAIRQRSEPVELRGLESVQIRQEFLPGSPPPREPEVTDLQGDCVVLARDLKPGRYTLEIDGRAVQTAHANAWMAKTWTMKPMVFKDHGLLVLQGPSLDQAEQLRRTIVEKNRLYFQRWRPQNQTYLLGFRAHEQGKNAKEIVQFDPLVAAKEKEIARLRVPVAHRYELVPEKEAAK